MSLMDVTGLISSQMTIGGVVAVGLTSFVLYLILEFSTSSKSSLPVINGRKLFEFSNANANRRYTANAKGLLELGLKKSKAFYLNTGHGPRLVLANDYAREIHNNPHLSLTKAIQTEMHCYIPGMEGYRHDYFSDRLRIGSMNLNIKRALGVIQKLEISSFLNTHWTENPEWHRFALNPIVLEMVSQLTAEVRSGKELSQNPNWRRLCVDFTIHSFTAAAELNRWPRYLRPIVHWFLPYSKLVRADIEEARTIFAPVAAARLAKKNAAIANGEKPPQYDDMNHWTEENSQGVPYDGALSQMLFAQAIIHGTADLITQVIFDICERPQLLEDLRAEIISVVGKDGLTQGSVANLHLMDSVLKESQRIKPLFMVNMKRYAEQAITLSDGTPIPKSTMLVLSMQNMWSPTTYPSPYTFQPHRFLTLRHNNNNDPARAHAAEFTSATTEHMGFGFGRHACPGRFYAVAFVKMVLCHVLLKYDLRLVGGRPVVDTYGVNMTASRTAEVEVRRRGGEGVGEGVVFGGLEG